MLFRRKKHKSSEEPIKEKAAKGIARFLLKLQTKFADTMNTTTKNISPKSMKLILVTFCFLGGGYSIYLIADAVLKPDAKQPEFKIEQMNVPKYYDKNGDDYLQTEQYVDEETYQRMETFELYMDSLQKTTDGRRIHDSILIARPGLMDSVKKLKEIYHSQLK